MTMGSQADEKAPTTAKMESLRFTKNIARLYHLYPKTETTSARSLESSEGPKTPYEYFASLDVVDMDGNPISFVSFSEDEKEVFLKAWVEDQAEGIAENMDGDSGALEELRSQNDALEAAVDSASRSSGADGFSDFLNEYRSIYLAENARRIESARSARDSRVSSSRSIDSLNPASVATLKSVYARGRVLINTDSSSSSGIYLGHAGMFSEPTWGVNWGIDGNGTVDISISSWAEDYAWWAGKTDGVQKEPLGAWASTDNKAPDSVKVYKVGNKSWYVDLTGYHSSFSTASTSRCADAVGQAEDELGDPYEYILANKWSTSSFYCSSIVWRAWYDVDSKYDLDSNWWDTWVSPADIANCEDVKRVASFNN